MYGSSDPIATLSHPRVRKKIALAAAVATFVGGLLTVPEPARAQAKPAGTNRPEVKSKEKPVPGAPVRVKPRRPDPAGRRQADPAPQASPEKVTITADGAEVRLADRETARRAGVDGLVFSVRPRPGAGAEAEKESAEKANGEKPDAGKAEKNDADAGKADAEKNEKNKKDGADAEAEGGPAGADTVTVTVDYSAYADAYGGSFGGRLRLVRLPACALTRPEDPACRTQIPVKAKNDPGRETLTAEVPVETGAPAVSPGTLRTMTTTAAAAAAAGEPTVLAAVSGASGDKGDYTATKPEPSSQWTVAEQSGDFSWSYPLRLPPVPGELTPEVEIGYSSGSLDGRTSNTNNQPSWVGEGFDYWPGYIKRAYQPCADDGAPKDQWGTPPGDLCWAYQNAVINWNGRAGELIQASDGTWRLRNDDGTRVELLKNTATGNGDDDGEYWKVTTTDGVQYYFGLNRLPGWSSGKPETKSAWTHPVFGDDPGEPCHAGSFAASWCRQAYQWNLDYVVDPHGNAVAFFYQQEINHYGRNLRPQDATPYVRGGWLERIEYGHRADTLFTAKAPARVLFTVAERCLPTDDFDCAPDKIASHPTRWPDVPYDLNCAAGTECQGTHGTVAPTFWTRKRLTGITTQVIQADGTYRDVDHWAFDHLWGDADIDQALLLKSITHTGRAASPAVTLPSVTFNHVHLPNRVDRQGDDIPPYLKYRLSAIYDESGGQLEINYSEPDCTLDDLPAPENNTRRCFPVKWTPAGYADPITDWFHKYVVTQVVSVDRTGQAPDMVTGYEYLDGAAWHYADDDGMTREKYKTWSQWRGYGRVRVYTGGWNDPRTLVEIRFLRGMHGDRLGPNGGTKQVTVSDGEGGTIVDADPLQGFELKRTEYDGVGGPVVTKTVNTPWYHQTASRTRSWGTVTANLVKVAKTRTWTALSGGGWRQTEKSTTYETTAGLPVQEEDKGDVATAADDRCTRTEYAQNRAAWMLDFPSRVEAVAVACSVAPDRSKHVISDERTFYDGGAFGAAPTRGDVTRTERIASHDGTTPVYTAQEVAAYDAYGRKLTSQDALGHVTTTEYTDTAGLTTAIKVTTPPAVPGNPATAHVTTTYLDPAFGNEVTEVDPNGRRTDTEYDALGRVVRVWLPDRSRAAGQTPNLEFTYQAEEGKIVAVGTRTLTASGALSRPTYELYDGLLRPRQVQEPGPDGGRLITDTFYDSRGNVAREYAQYYATGAPSPALFGAFEGNVESQRAYEYDGLNRVTVERFLVGNGQTQEKWRTVTTYSGDRISVDPPDGDTPVTTVLDARGRIVELRQYKGDSPSGEHDKTTYTYTPAGELATVTDAAGNVWRYTYDLRGRQIRAEDPDRGTTTRTYDDLDRLVSTTDAEGRTVFYAYDPLGRRTAIREGGPTGPLLASWTYDTVRKGHLSSATRHANGQAYTTTVNAYDNLYRPIRTTVSIPAAEGALAGDYVFDTRYALDGTVQSTTFPNAGGLPAETVVHTYDELLRPVRTSGLSTYVTDSRHSLTGKPEQYELSTGGKKTWFTYAYEYGTQRLASSRVDREDVSGADREVTYGYDPAGNITAISEVSRTGTETQCFRYDHLRRLTEAWTQGTRTCAPAPSPSVVGGVQPYWQSFAYDVTGNRVREVHHGVGGAADTVRDYAYPDPGDPQPHALATVTQTGDAGDRVETYAYDRSGNTVRRVIGDRDQRLEWDVEGRLSKVIEDGKVTSYLYDADGNRLIRRDPTGTTLYLPGMELRLDDATARVTATRYYTHDTVRIAVRTPEGVSFLSTDQHGTSELAINAATHAIVQRRFEPFGRLRGAPPGSWPDDKGFVGGTVDDTTGLIHLGAREYDPATGRFLSVDPLIDHYDPQQMHGYAYANNSPITFTDPDGEFFRLIVRAVKAVVRVVKTVVKTVSRVLGGGGGGGGRVLRRTVTLSGGGSGGQKAGKSQSSWGKYGSAIVSNLWSAVNPLKWTVLGWLAVGLTYTENFFKQLGENIIRRGELKAGRLRDKAARYPKGRCWLTKLFWKARRWWTNAKADRIEARAIKWGTRALKLGKGLGYAGAVVAFVDGAYTQWQNDADTDYGTGERLARAGIRGGIITGAAIGGASLGAAICSPGAVAAATCSVVGGYIGGALGSPVADLTMVAYDKARGPVISLTQRVRETMADVSYRPFL